jgi:hypothetical protein
MELPYLVLKNILDNKYYESGDNIEFLLQLLNFIHTKKKPKNKILYDKINKVFNYFNHVDKHQWTEIFLKLMKYLLNQRKDWSSMTIIKTQNYPSNNVIFQNDYVTIVKNKQEVIWVYQDHNLLDGCKYITQGKFLNRSLQNQFQKIVDKIITIL